MNAVATQPLPSNRTAPASSIATLKRRITPWLYGRSQRERPSEWRSGLELKIASTWRDYRRALGLVYHAYQASGLVQPNESKLRVMPHHLLDTTEVFLAFGEKKQSALASQQPISTVTLVGDSDLGLPMEDLYRDEVDAMRRSGVEVGEVSCLADDREGGESRLSAVIEVMSLMAQSAKKRGIHMLLISVHPRHVQFYKRFIGFVTIGEEKPYGAVCNNPAVPLALDLHRWHIDHPRGYKRFCGKPFSADVMEYRPLPKYTQKRLRTVADPPTDIESQHRGNRAAWTSTKPAA